MSAPPQAPDDDFEWEGLYGEKDLPERPRAVPAVAQPASAATGSASGDHAPTPDKEAIDFGPTFLWAGSGGNPAARTGPKGSLTNPLVVPEKPATRHLDVARALTTAPPPRDFSLPCLRAGTVGGLVSPGGAGKSMLAAQLALMVATGLDTLRGLMGRTGWEHLTVGPVHYASFEDGEDDAAARLHAIWKALGAAANADDLATAAANLSVETLNGLRPPNLLDGGEWAEWLLMACAGKRLVLIDTLRMAHLGDENDSGAMAQLLAVMQGAAMQTGAAILFLHHISKGAALSGQGSSQQAARGSSVITDNARGQFFLAGMTEEETTSQSPLYDHAAPPYLRSTPLHGDDPDGRPMRTRYVRFGVAKSNYSAPWPDVWLRRDEHGVLAYANLGPQGASAGGKKGGRGATLA